MEVRRSWIARSTEPNPTTTAPHLCRASSFTTAGSSRSDTRTAFTRGMPLPGWSMAKSVLNALVGMLVDAGTAVAGSAGIAAALAIARIRARPSRSRICCACAAVCVSPKPTAIRGPTCCHMLLQLPRHGGVHCQPAARGCRRDGVELLERHDQHPVGDRATRRSATSRLSRLAAAGTVRSDRHDERGLEPDGAGTFV